MKRATGLLVAVLMLTMLPSPVTAQGQEAMFTDAAGDVRVQTADGTDAGSSDQFKYVDLIEGGILAEDDETVTFFVETTELEPTSETPVAGSDPDYFIYFTFGARAYRVVAYTVLDNPLNSAFGRSDTFAALQEEGGGGGFGGGFGGGWRTVTGATADFDFAENRVMVDVPRKAIVDENEAPLALGSTLHTFYATAQSMGWFALPVGFGEDPVTYAGPPKAFDRAPDQGEVGAYVMQTGAVQQHGVLHAASADPIRWSNGEATTMTYTVLLRNSGTDSQTVEVTANDYPSTWSMAHSELVKVDPGQTVNVSVQATIPFSHAHGTTELFIIEFSSEDGHATAQLGVHWPHIPQPAGHHDTIYFHGRADSRGFAPADAVFPETDGWINAADATIDAEDQGTPVSADFVSTLNQGNQQGYAAWNLPLSPGLRMGLDFDLSRVGTFAGAFNLPVPMADVSLEATLYHDVWGAQGSRTVLAEGTSEVVAGAVSGKQVFDFDMVPTAEADLVSYNPDAQISLRLVIRGTMVGTWFTPGEASPKLLPAETKMTLPLFEYIEAVDQSFVTDRSIRLDTLETPQERKLNPGKTLLYRFSVTYQGDEADAFDLSLNGKNTEWGKIVGDETITLQPGEARTLALQVKAPTGAISGDQADITLTLTSTSNAAVQAGIRTVSTVVNSPDIPDEADKAMELSGELSSKESPGIGLMALLAAVALAFVARRR